MSDSLELEVAKKLMGRVEFVSYDGRYPNLCSGTLVIRVAGVQWEIERLNSGGSAGVGSDGDEYISHGSWSVNDWPDGFPDEYKEDVVRLTNDNVVQGCCGGCI